MTNTCIYVYNLTKNVSEKHLKEIFTCFGALKTVNLLVEKEENEKEQKIKEFKGGRYAKLEFETKEDAENAMEYMNGGQIDGKMIALKYEKGSEDSQYEHEKHVKEKRISQSKTKSEKRKSSISHASIHTESSSSLLSSRNDSRSSSDKYRKRHKKR